MVLTLKGGVLPPGEHEQSLSEFEKQFVYNDSRAAIFKGFLRLLDDLRQFNVLTIYIGGSFITDKEEPSDIDVCWMDYEGIDLDLLEKKFPQLLEERYLNPPRKVQQLMYNADVFPANSIEIDSNLTFKEFLKRDMENGKLKGIIEINISYDKE